MGFLGSLFSKKKNNGNATSQSIEKSQGTTNDTEILRDIYWSFDEKYESKEAFDSEMKQYQVDIGKEDTWQPDSIVLEQPAISLLLEMGWADPPLDEVTFQLESENKENFTALDLMFQLNNVLAEYDLGDHRFFEGLDHDPEDNRYTIRLGS